MAQTIAAGEFERDTTSLRSSASGVGRIHAIDLLRGLVIIIMALDHVRDFWSVTAFWPEDLSQTTPAYFFTRWITHFCAPVFVFLSGTSAWLYQLNRGASRADLARFLLTRGIWLIFIELTWVSFSWQLTYQVAFLQVIWVLGWSMIILAGLIYLPKRWLLALALMVVLGHNLLDGIQADQFGAYHWLWLALHQNQFLRLENAPIAGIFFAYPLIPWFAVMALGYCAGSLFTLPVAKRDRVFYLTGAVMIAAFFILRGLNLYGNPVPWQGDERGWLWEVIALLNTQKYPPSLHYLLMTLGPALLITPLLERWRGRLAQIVEIFGKVPFFFYLLHLPLINITAKIWQHLAFGEFITPLLPSSTWPAAYMPSLLRAYLVWVVIVFVLYWPCRWFVGIRRRYNYWWLSYL